MVPVHLTILLYPIESIQQNAREDESYLRCRRVTHWVIPWASYPPHRECLEPHASIKLRGLVTWAQSQPRRHWDRSQRQELAPPIRGSLFCSDHYLHMIDLSFHGRGSPLNARLARVPDEFSDPNQPHRSENRQDSGLGLIRFGSTISPGLAVCSFRVRVVVVFSK